MFLKWRKWCCLEDLSLTLSSVKCSTYTASTLSSDDLSQQLGQYLTEVQIISFWAGSALTARDFWKTKLAAVALDILATPVSQAYVERLFSVCGLLSSGRRNHMTRSLTVRVWRWIWTFCDHLVFCDWLRKRSKCKMPVIILIHLSDWVSLSLL